MFLASRLRQDWAPRKEESQDVTRVFALCLRGFLSEITLCSGIIIILRRIHHHGVPGGSSRICKRAELQCSLLRNSLG